MKEDIVYIPVPVEERLPEKANENYLTISERGIETSRFFNGKRFETAHYEGEIIHWLEPTTLSELIKEKGYELLEDYTKFLNWNGFIGSDYQTPLKEYMKNPKLLGK